jgi:NAD(P)-dependent dehydrogenase (short-subunit alcohol dehydrogenase family)
MGKFDGRVAIITGGGKGGGIGYGLSTAFAKEGCNLVITGRNTKKLDDAKEELERLYGVKVLACQADGGVEEQVAAVVKQAADTLGRIDFLINNAQNSASGVPLAEHTKEQFDQAIYSGLYAAFFYMKHCYPYLKETKGSVVNFASGAGLFGKPGQSSYAAAKEGIRGMTRVAATEWGPDGINCNLICPLVMTDALKKWREEYPAVYEQTIKGIPAGRLGVLCLVFCFGIRCRGLGCCRSSCCCRCVRCLQAAACQGTSYHYCAQCCTHPSFFHVTYPPLYTFFMLSHILFTFSLR